jgi:hypothetical protein
LGIEGGILADYGGGPERCCHGSISPFCYVSSSIPGLQAIGAYHLRLQGRSIEKAKISGLFHPVPRSAAYTNLIGRGMPKHGPSQAEACAALDLTTINSLMAFWPNDNTSFKNSR